MELFDRLKAALAGRYTLERKLGAGGMAMVYLAHDERHNRKVAIKVMHPDLAAVVTVNVDLEHGGSSTPEVLFTGPYPDNPGWTRPRSYDVTADGERFLMSKRPDPPARPRIVVVLNWLDELDAKFPGEGP